MASYLALRFEASAAHSKYFAKAYILHISVCIEAPWVLADSSAFFSCLAASVWLPSPIIARPR